MVVLLMFVFFAAACHFMEDDKVYQILFDGEPIAFEVDPVRMNGKVYAEYSSLFKALGFQPEYDSDTKMIKAISPNRTIEISEDGSSAFVDGYSVYTAEDVKKIEGHIMVSVQFVVSNSGKQMNWDAEKKILTIIGPTTEQEAAFLSF